MIFQYNYIKSRTDTKANGDAMCISFTSEQSSFISYQYRPINNRFIRSTSNIRKWEVINPFSSLPTFKCHGCLHKLRTSSGLFDSMQVLQIVPAGILLYVIGLQFPTNVQISAHLPSLLRPTNTEVAMNILCP